MLDEHPLVVLEGARATGKTTLARQLMDSGVLGGAFVSLDDELEVASTDPERWLASLPDGSIIDEAQLLPELLLALKRAVDSDPTPGRFLLTGSSRLRRDTLGGSDALAGRAARIQLHAMTLGEAAGAPVSIVESLLHGDPTDWNPGQLSRVEILDATSRGGLPGGLGLSDEAFRDRFDSYPDRALGPQVVGNRRYTAVVRILHHILTESPVPENATDLARTLGVSRDTVLSYLEAIEESFLMWRLRGLTGLDTAGELARARLMAFDTGIGAAIGGGAVPEAKAGRAVETLVANELRAQASWSTRTAGVAAHHWRFKTRAEVDLVLRDTDGTLAAIEIKLSSRPDPKHTRWLSAFRRRYDGKAPAIRSYVFYTGTRVVPFEDHWFVPIGALLGI